MEKDAWLLLAIGLANILALLFLIMGEITIRTFGWFIISEVIIGIYVALIKYFKEEK